MSYSKHISYNFGPAYVGALANAKYALDGGTWQALVEKLDPSGNPTGIGIATVTFADGYTGDVLLTPDSTATPIRYAVLAVNPGDFENADAKTSTVPASVWSNGSRTLSAFAFSVTVSGFSGSPTFRNQDGVTSPTYDDCLASAWAAANSTETENDTAKTWVRNLPNGSPMRSFALTMDANGNPIGRS